MYFRGLVKFKVLTNLESIFRDLSFAPKIGSPPLGGLLEDESRENPQVCTPKSAKSAKNGNTSEKNVGEGPYGSPTSSFVCSFHIMLISHTCSTWSTAIIIESLFLRRNVRPIIPQNLNLTVFTVILVFGRSKKSHSYDFSLAPIISELVTGISL